MLPNYSPRPNNYFTADSIKANQILESRTPNTWLVRSSPTSGFCLSIVNDPNNINSHVILQVSTIDDAFKKCAENYVKWGINPDDYFGPTEKRFETVLNKINKLVKFIGKKKPSFDYYVNSTNKIIKDIETHRNRLFDNCLVHPESSKKAIISLEKLIAKIDDEIDYLQNFQSPKLLLNRIRLKNFVSAFEIFDKKRLEKLSEKPHLYFTSSEGLISCKDVVFEVQQIALQNPDKRYFNLVKSIYAGNEQEEFYTLCAQAISNHRWPLKYLKDLTKKAQRKICPLLTHLKYRNSDSKDIKSLVKLCSKVESAKSNSMHFIKHLPAPELIKFFELKIVSFHSDVDFSKINKLKNLEYLKFEIRNKSNPGWNKFAGLASDSLETIELTGYIPKNSINEKELLENLQKTNPNLKTAIVEKTDLIDYSLSYV